MAIKKSELYSSLWASCDELRGGMDASQYKDYVLVMLFLKYISDKWAGQPFAPIVIPPGSGFRDMVALKGTTDIGDQINKKIVAPIAAANHLADMPDFNDVSKLGSGKEMVDRLTNLIAIFEKPELDFSKNKAEGDDILGDAYEYLMRHFATESGKSKGQFYTPAEVSRLMAKIIGINSNGGLQPAGTRNGGLQPAGTRNGGLKPAATDTTVYDPTCGSGSLLLKVSDEAKSKVTLYGQEKDAATSGLARMNMILHNYPTAEIKQGNTLANPLFKTDDGALKTFDFVVANPPFSDKRWSNGLTLPADEPFRRFQDFGTPPEKNGDYAFLLHILRSLKSKGKGAVILPHGVLFRGNAEAEIRRNLLRRGVIKAVIGLPANLFYGTGIPAAIILIDKENAHTRKGIFMVDAGKGFVKDGNKNRLREQDLHKIADLCNAQKEVPGFSKMVPLTDIEANDFNLNIPRYIENQDGEDLHDLSAHLLGGLPEADIHALQAFWTVFPKLKNDLFAPNKRAGYLDLKMKKEDINDTIFAHPEFTAFSQGMDALFEHWKTAATASLKALDTGFQPKTLIHDLSENLLAHYQNKPLLDAYDMYQIMMTYWAETMQDDAYLISANGWRADTYRIIQKGKGDKTVDKGWTCDLVPKDLVTRRFFQKEKLALDALLAQKESLAAELTELEEEHSGEDGYFADLEKVNKAAVTARLQELKATPDAADEIAVLKRYIAAADQLADTGKAIKTAEADLDQKLLAKYPTLTPAEVKTLVVDDKWMRHLATAIADEISRTSQNLTQRIRQLAERYESPLPRLDAEAKALEETVAAHLQNLGLSWK